MIKKAHHIKSYNYKTRNGKSVKVKPHTRNYNHKQLQKISREEAMKIMAKRSNKKKTVKNIEIIAFDEQLAEELQNDDCYVRGVQTIDELDIFEFRSFESMDRTGLESILDYEFDEAKYFDDEL